MKLFATIALSAVFLTANAQTTYDVITVNQQEMLVDTNEIEKNKIINSQNGFSNDHKVIAKRGSHLGKAEPETSDDEVLIIATLQNYINGSSYHETDLIENAFTAEATLYLAFKEEFQGVSPTDYTWFFKNYPSMVYNGGVGNILALCIERDFAMAKVEKAIPSRNTQFIGLFLLKDFDDDWKIIGKTGTLMHPLSKK